MPATENRYQVIKDHISDQKVLDIGIVAHDLSDFYSGDWLHGMIVEGAESCVGIDILEGEVAELRSRGYDARVESAEDFELNEKFDVIVAGELIEHLSDFRGFLNCCYDHLRPNGKLILTTPNGLSFIFPLRRLFMEEVFNPEHTCLFDKQTLGQLVNRHGFEVKKVEYIKTNPLQSYYPSSLFREALERYLPDRVGKETILMIATKN